MNTPSSRKSATKTSRPRAAATKKAATAVVAPARASKKAAGKVATTPRAASRPVPAQPRQASKQSRLIDLLASAPGATIEQMMKLTGWQAHTVRGTISGVLRKRLGLNVACTAGDAGTVYRIIGKAAA